MVVMILERATPRLRGELRRWMIEPKPGVFVGTMSAIVRDGLWDKTVAEMGEAGCMQVFTKNNEQGFEIRQCGKMERQIVDIEGLQLVFSPKAQ